MVTTITHKARIARIRSKGERNALGKLVVVYVQPACTCGWRGVLYSTQTIEGWDLSARDAVEHAICANKEV